MQFILKVCFWKDVQNIEVAVKIFFYCDGETNVLRKMASCSLISQVQCPIKEMVKNSLAVL